MGHVAGAEQVCFFRCAAACTLFSKSFRGVDNFGDEDSYRQRAENLHSQLQKSLPPVSFLLVCLCHIVMPLLYSLAGQCTLGGGNGRKETFKDSLGLLVAPLSSAK